MRTTLTHTNPLSECTFFEAFSNMPKNTRSKKSDKKYCFYKIYEALLCLVGCGQRERERVRKMEGVRTGVYAQVAQSSASNWGVWVNAKTYVKRQKRRRRRVEAFFVGFI